MMRKLALIAAIGASMWFGGTAAQAASTGAPGVKAGHAVDQSTEFSSQRRHWRHRHWHHRHWHHRHHWHHHRHWRHYGWAPYYRSYGYYPAPVVSFGFGPRWGWGHRHWHHRHYW
ncbi:hypothetical protein X566_17735 [Afipia sp. P52-10]|jgi:hypothetical protein|uniref:hypothetical protein n=1 Tax=Afipia sp. P52-10 TaxID=1429916 RepID=UPI0003DF3D02|nr:hypothetical protein [Afipia sp. P52-10]ETR76459.1 hypothetical protein X566_17735 [Afipia sp. P52-10]